MDILMLAIAGIGLLVSGIFTMRYGLKKLLWGRLQQCLAKITRTPWQGVLVGTIAAALLQSSTAVSLITIGLVSAEYLTFYQSLGIILGANIGTCCTVQLMAFTLPAQYSWPLLILTFLVGYTNKKFRHTAMAGGGLLAMFTGLQILTAALADIPKFDTVMNCLMAAKTNPAYGIAGGVLITLFFQSSSAATGVLMLLTEDHLLDLETAAYVVYGNNIGSCLSSVVVGATAPLAARRVAISHIVLNLLGVIIALPCTTILTTTATYLTNDIGGQVAAVHTLFNIASSLMVLPVVKQYSHFILFLTPAKK
ncbi:MAG: Na/Pi symporter [Veillonellales bacterium]